MTEREPDEEESTVIIDNDLPPPTPVSRVIPGAVLLLAGIGFIALAWYAYTTGTRTLNDDELMVVEADKTPVKEKPLDPGGMKFPHQDKMIFEAISGAPAPAHEEHVTPSPEEPVARPQAAEQTPGAPETSSEATTTETHAVAVQPEAPETVKTDQAAVAPAETPQATPAAASFNPPPAVQAASPPESLPPPAKRVTPAAEEQPQPAPQKPKAAASVAKPGSAQVQLGAYRSEGEARSAWDKMVKKYQELSGMEPAIVKADLGAKGVFYRLRLAVAGAKALCASLSAKGQACIPVK